MQRWLLVIGGLLFGAIFWGLVALPAAIAPDTQEAAIAKVLVQADIPYQALSLENGHCIPTREYCRSYIADVVIRGPALVRGRMSCQAPGAGCTLWIVEYGMRGTVLSDVRPYPAWLIAIQNQAERAGHWLRERISGAQQVLKAA